MPSPIEVYHAASMAVVASEEAIDEHIQRLRGVLAGLRNDTLLRPVRFPYEEVPTDRDDEEQVVVALPLKQMPTREKIAEALMTLDKARKNLSKAYDGLSEIEKSYVSAAGAHD